MWFTSKDSPIDVVENTFKKQGLKYHRLDSETILSGFGAGEHHFLVGIRHEEDRKTILFIFHPLMSAAHMLQAIAGGNAPYFRVHESAGHTTEQVHRVCERLLKMNYEMLVGAFERDDSDGEIRYRVDLLYRDTRVSEEQVKWCIQIGLPTVARGIEEIKEIVGTAASSSQMEI